MSVRRPRRVTVVVAPVLLVLALVLAGCSATVHGNGAPAATGKGQLTPLTGNDVLFFGDSWVSGYGSDQPKTQGFVPLTAQEFGWHQQAVFVAGGGYVKTGGQGQTFIQRLKQETPDLTTPDLVVLEGGLNDRSENPSDVADGYTQVIAVMRANWPKAQIVTLGPMAPTAVAVSGVTDIDAALDKAAATLDVPYLDAQQQGWLGDGAAQASYVNTEKGNHPSAAGYAQIASKLVAALKGLGL